jgi:hypothetical protein
MRAFEPDEVLWFVQREGHSAELTPRLDGIYRVSGRSLMFLYQHAAP